MKKYLLACAMSISFVSYAYSAGSEYDEMGALSAVNAAAAYSMGYTGNGVTVMVIDSGIDITHPEFLGKISPVSYNAMTGGVLSDPGTHGTHVAGIIGALKNGVGMHGVAYGSSSLLAGVGVSSDGLSISGAGVNAAYNTMIANSSIKISNNSYGSGISLIDAPANVASYKSSLASNYVMYDSVLLNAMINYDKLAVFAAGNEGNFQPSTDSGIPYAIPEVMGNMITVVAYDPSLVTYANKATYGNAAIFPDFTNLCGNASAYCIAAPGVGIYSTIPGGYGFKSGTSMATPVVAGALALVNQAFPGMSAKQLSASIFQNAIKEADINAGGVTYNLTRYVSDDANDVCEDSFGNPTGDCTSEARNVSFENAVGQGFLDIGEAVKGPKTFAVADWGTYFTYNAPSNTLSRFKHDITGDAGYKQTGAGEVLFEGNNVYTGGTVINGGYLMINGGATLTSNVEVNNTGLFGGYGAVAGDVNVTSGGALKVGQEGFSGTFAINGNMVSNDGNLHVKAGSDEVQVSLASEVNGGSVYLERGSAVTGSHIVLRSTGGITGTGYNETLSSLYAFVRGTVSTNANDVTVDITRNSTLSDISSLTPNQRGVANAFNDLEDSDPSTVLITSKIYELETDDQVKDALNEASGTILANQMGGQVASQATSNVFSRLGKVSLNRQFGALMSDDDNETYQVASAASDFYFPQTMQLVKSRGLGGGVWAQPFAGYSNVKRDKANNLPRYETAVYGVQAGVDGYVKDNLLIGATISYGQGETKQKETKIEVDDIRLGLYAGSAIKDFEIKGLTSFGYQRYDSDRKLDTFGVAAKSSYEGWNMDFNVDGAYNLFTTNNGLKFKVISGAEVLYSYTNGFTENGAGGLSLDVKSMNETSTNAKVGFGVEKVTKDYGISTNVYYKRLISGYDSDMEARFTGGTTYFKVKGYDFEENMGGAEVSYEYNVTPRSTVYFDVVGEGSRDVMSVAGTAGVRYKF